MLTAVAQHTRISCRSPCGERGLKLGVLPELLSAGSRSPCGERGLKLVDGVTGIQQDAVAPRAGSVD